MSKTQKLRERILESPTDFTWDNLVTLLEGFGFQERKKKGGSYRTFFDAAGRKIFLHRPHPTNVLKSYAVEDVVGALRNFGLLESKDEE